MRTTWMLRLIGFVIALGAFAMPARAQLSITIDRGNFQPMPIAITDFAGPDQALSALVNQVITNNLRRSGVFQPIDKNAFIEKVNSPDVVPNFASWKAINVWSLSAAPAE